MLELDEKWARVTLRLRGDRLPLNDIGELLGLTPNSIGRDGEPIGGRPGRAKHIGDSWCWNVPANSSQPLEEQIEMALDAIEPKRVELERLLRDGPAEADLFLGFSSGNGQGGAYLSVELLGRIVSLGLPVLFDLYPPSVEPQ
jgi:Domain of unknown function (DUF4279)